MQTERYTIDDLAADLRRARDDIVDTTALVRAIEDLAVRFVACKSQWLLPTFRQVNADQGFGVHLLHEEPDHSLPVFVVAWMPGRGAPPHNHGTGNWAVVTGIDGEEANVWWQPTGEDAGPGFTPLRRCSEVLIGGGEAVAFQPDEIHSVHNNGDEISLSLHIYAMHLNHVPRTQFDPETGREQPFKVATA